MSLISLLGSLENVCEFEANLIYIRSSGQQTVECLSKTLAPPPHPPLLPHPPPLSPFFPSLSQVFM